MTEPSEPQHEVMRKEAHALKKKANEMLAKSRSMKVEADRQEREARYARERQEIEDAKAALAEEFGLERNAKFERAWDIAWEYGYSSGLEEVKNHFAELSDLLKP